MEHVQSRSRASKDVESSFHYCGCPVYGPITPFIPPRTYCEARAGQFLVPEIYVKAVYTTVEVL